MLWQLRNGFFYQFIMQAATKFRQHGNRLQTFGWLILGLTFGSQTHANSPVICLPKNVAFKNRSAVLNYRGQTIESKIYFIKNTSSQGVWITHPNHQRKGMHAGWGSYLEPGKGSAILISNTNFLLNCSRTKANQTIDLKCGKFLRLCQTTLNLQNINEGNYWFVENKPWQTLKQAVLKRLDTEENVRP